MQTILILFILLLLLLTIFYLITYNQIWDDFKENVARANYAIDNSEVETYKIYNITLWSLVIILLFDLVVVIFTY